MFLNERFFDIFELVLLRLITDYLCRKRALYNLGCTSEIGFKSSAIADSFPVCMQLSYVERPLKKWQ